MGFLGSEGDRIYTGSRRKRMTEIAGDLFVALREGVVKKEAWEVDLETGLPRIRVVELSWDDVWARAIENSYINNH